MVETSIDQRNAPAQSLGDRVPAWRAAATRMRTGLVAEPRHFHQVEKAVGRGKLLHAELRLVEDGEEEPAKHLVDIAWIGAGDLSVEKAMGAVISVNAQFQMFEVHLKS